MAYSLTLTHDERRAIDWVGHRYSNGDRLYLALQHIDVKSTPDEADWDHAVDITYNLPEHIAWRIQEIAEEDNGLWPCFGSALTEKMNALLNSIV